MQGGKGMTFAPHGTPILELRSINIVSKLLRYGDQSSS